MSAIRPDLPVPQSGTGLTRPGGTAADAARAAFFRAAMGQVQAAQTPARTAAATPTAPTTQTSTARPDSSPDRPGRPGSLLDIRV